MKEYPRLFKDEMVRAIMAGRKTQTRSPVPKKQQPGPMIDGAFCRSDGRWAWQVGGYTSGAPFKSPFGGPGDRLWVRECFQMTRPKRSGERFIVRNPAPGLGDLHYRADQESDPPPKWRPSIHMPRWACRTLLEVLDVRLERIQDITEEDAKAEGFQRREHFLRDWDATYEAKGVGVDETPGVFAATFRVIE